MSPGKRSLIDFHSGEGLGRIASLSDGVFATVLTILVLDLKPDLSLPASTGQGILPFLQILWPKIINYLLTFAVAGLFWVRHHWIFEHVVAYDRRLMWMNLMFLLSIILLPFTTALLGVQSDVALGFRWQFYAGVIILISLMVILLWEYAYSHHLTDPRLDPQLIIYDRIRQAATPFVFFLSIVFEPFLPSLVFYFPILILPIRSLISMVMRKAGHLEGAEQEDVGRGFWKNGFWILMSFLPLVVFFVLNIWLLIAFRK